MIRDTCVIFNISPKIAAAFFAIMQNDKNMLTDEFLKILMKICSKGNTQINRQIRLFSIIYIYNFGVIYDFCHLLENANNKFNDLYNTSKNKLIQSNSFLNDIFNFSVDLINQIKNSQLDLKNVIEDIQNKFINQDFLNKIKKEIFAPNKNGHILKLLDGNYAVNIINNLRQKLPYFYESGFNLLDFNLNLSFLNDYIYSYQPLVTSLKLALENLSFKVMNIIIR